MNSLLIYILGTECESKELKELLRQGENGTKIYDENSLDYRLIKRVGNSLNKKKDLKDFYKRNRNFRSLKWCTEPQLVRFSQKGPDVTRGKLYN